MLFDNGETERADAYRAIAAFYTKPPAAEDLNSLRGDLELKSAESEYEIFEDFNRLFALPAGILPPVESRYTGDEGSNIAEALEEAYAEADLTFPEEYELVPDHLALECLFMSYLVEAQKVELQAKFLEEHLMNWVPYFCEQVQQEAKTLFYREIAEITKGFLERESGEFE